MNKPFRRFLALALLTSCVTVNVNFPESAVQKASDDYVKELYKTKEKSKLAPAGSATTPQSRLEWWIPSAQADLIGEIKFDSAPVKIIQARQAARIDALTQNKGSGFIGETKNGLTQVRDPAQMPKPILDKVQKLVNEENKDRTELIEAIRVEKNLNPAQVDGIRKSFMHSFQNLSPAGTWIESESGDWARRGK